MFIIQKCIEIIDLRYWRCTICNRSFRTIFNLTVHIIRSNDGEHKRWRIEKGLQGSYKGVLPKKLTDAVQDMIESGSRGTL